MAVRLGIPRLTPFLAFQPAYWRYLRNGVSLATRSYSVKEEAHPNPEGLSQWKAGDRGPPTALITGGSRGIGLAIAKHFMSHGNVCTIIGRDDSVLKKVVAGSPQMSYVVGDVRHREFWESLASGSVQKFDSNGQGSTASPAVDVLVNAAGITHSSLLRSTEAGTIEDVIDTNLMGTIWACKYLTKGMKGMLWRAKQKDRIYTSSIINISSLLALQGGRGTAAYSASKAGVLGLTRSLAAELGPLGIRVNAVVPGYIDTDMTKVLEGPAQEFLKNRIPLRRFGQSEEIAHAAMFLVSNRYANNCVINIDGGLSAVIC